MSTDRIIDAHGAAWPVTGRWCDTCGMPMALEVAESAHPGCQEVIAGTDDGGHDEVLGLLAATLGAHPPGPVVLGTRRRTGRPVVAR